MKTTFEPRFDAIPTRVELVGRLDDETLMILDVRTEHEFRVFEFWYNTLGAPSVRGPYSKVAARESSLRNSTAPGLSRRDVTGTVRNGKLARTDP